MTARSQKALTIAVRELNAIVTTHNASELLPPALKMKITAIAEQAKPAIWRPLLMM